MQKFWAEISFSKEPLRLPKPISLPSISMAIIQYQILDQYKQAICLVLFSTFTETKLFIDLYEGRIHILHIKASTIFSALI